MDPEPGHPAGAKVVGLPKFCGIYMDQKAKIGFISKKDALRNISVRFRLDHFRAMCVSLPLFSHLLLIVSKPEHEKILPRPACAASNASHSATICE